MSDTEAERVARSVETREPYKSPMQIAVAEIGHEDTVIVLGQGDYPTMKHIADRDVRAANRAAAFIRSQAARIAELEAELAEANLAEEGARQRLAVEMQETAKLRKRLDAAKEEGRQAGLREAADEARAAMKKYAAEHYSPTVTAYRPGHCADKAYCAGEILERILALLTTPAPDPVGEAAKVLLDYMDGGNEGPISEFLHALVRGRL